MKFRVSSAVFGCVDLRDREIPLQSIQTPSDFSQAIRLVELRTLELNFYHIKIQYREFCQTDTLKTPNIVESVSMARQEILVEQ